MALTPHEKSSTIVPVFVDTNVLVYARDPSETDKQSRAAEWLKHLWRPREGRLSFQVLHEYYVATTRKLTPGLAPEQARADIQDLLAWRPVPVDAEVLQGAWIVEDRFGLGFWDSLIVSAACVANCHHLLTEDLQHGQELDDIQVVNPFLMQPELLG